MGFWHLTTSKLPRVTILDVYVKYFVSKSPVFFDSCYDHIHMKFEINYMDRRIETISAATLTILGVCPSLLVLLLLSLKQKVQKVKKMSRILIHQYFFLQMQLW